MINVALLEELARPIPAGGSVRLGAQLPGLEELFALLADGWAPRSPCANPEELGLNGAAHRGDCLLPILRAGDTVYVDPDTPAQSGDLVRLRLSKRGAAAQIRTKFGPCFAGDYWLKIFVRWRGFDFLLENTGNAATATLLACENPDDVPVLHPVRNIRRGGRLLFAPTEMAPAMLPVCRESDGPNLDGAQLAANAATGLYTASDAGPHSVTSAGASTLTLASSLLTLPNVPDSSQAWEVTVTMEASDNEGTDYGGQGAIGILYDAHTALPSDTFQYGVATPCSNSKKPMTVTAVFNGTVGTTTNTINLFATFTAGGITVTAASIVVRAALIKR